MSFDIVKSLTNEFTHESANTRKLLARIPLEKKIGLLTKNQ